MRAEIFIKDAPCVNGHSSGWYVKNGDCRECSLIKDKKYKDANRDKLLAENRARWAKAREEGRARKKTADEARAEYLRTKEKHLKRTADYRRRNLAQYASYKRNRDARLRHAPGSHTASDVADILKMQRGRCGYCRCRVGDDFHVDHITPLARGGSNGRSNLQVLCGPCNMRKSDIDPVEFAQRLGRLL